MTEKRVIAGSQSPVTLQSLCLDLQTLGIRDDDHLLVHSSLSALGWVCGGAESVIGALQKTLAKGTLLMPTHTNQLSDPNHWQNPPVPKSWHNSIREHLPPYDPQRTATCGMGQIAEQFRCYPHVKRSQHPQFSFAAWGQQRDYFIHNHKIRDSLGDSSPLGRLYKQYGRILLLGVDYSSCTALHLSEYRGQAKAYIDYQAPVAIDQQRQWLRYRDIDFDNDDFMTIGKAFQTTNDSHCQRGMVGQAVCYLIDMVPLVDFAADWMAHHR